MVHAPVLERVSLRPTSFLDEDVVLEPTFGIDPLRIQVGQSRSVVQLLQWLLRFLVDLEDTTGSPSPA